MRKKTPFFISTAIPYVNANPHLGHALEFVEADIIARHRRLAGRETFFLSGTDDNSLKNMQAAESAGVKVEAYIKERVLNFKSLLQKLNVSNDDFIQTSTDKRHFEGVQKLWKACQPEDIYKKKYRGLYCVGCEEFKTDKDLINSECPAHPGKKLEEVEEENYFFKLSNYQDKLLALIENETLKVIPETRKNETLSFIKMGLEDFSISRSAKRVKNWGLPVPGDKKQIIYVWFDALSNYINAIDYATDGEKFKKFWEKGEKVHVIGKDINRFHTIYWPAMLLSAGVKVPDIVFVHGFITSGGQKMSKSVGNVIDPSGIINEYGSEAARYILSREVSSFEDSDLTLPKIKESYNANLANGLGNLVSRVMKMAEEHLSGPVEITEDKTLPQEYTALLDKFDIQKATDFIWKEIADIDLQIQQEEPFKAVKEHKETGQALIRNLVHRLYKVAEMLAPFLPETAEKIKNLIKENKMPAKPLFPRKE